MEQEEYFKGKDSFQNKEKKLYELISELDKKSLELYMNISNIDNISNCDIDSLSKQIKDLNSNLDRLSASLEYLDLKEELVVNDSSNSLLLKGLLCIALFCIICAINRLLGLISLVCMIDNLSRKAKVVEKIKDEKKDNLDTSGLDLIRRTLENAQNILDNKIKKYTNGENSINSGYGYGAYNTFTYSEYDNYMTLIL